MNFLSSNRKGNNFCNVQNCNKMNVSKNQLFVGVNTDNNEVFTLINGLSYPLQKVIILDIVLDIYSKLLENDDELINIGYESFLSNVKTLKINEFIDTKFAFFDTILIRAKEVNYKNHSKIEEQINIFKANKVKLNKLVNQQFFEITGININKVNKVVLEDNLKQNNHTEVYEFVKFSNMSQLNLTHELRFLLSDIFDVISEYKYVKSVPNEESDESATMVRELNIINRKIMLQAMVRVDPDIVVTDLLSVLTKSNFDAGLSNVIFSFDNDLNLHTKIQLIIHLLKSELTYKPYFFNVIKKLENLNPQIQQQFLRTFNKALTNHITVLEYIGLGKDKLSLRVIGSAPQNAKISLIQEWKNNLEKQDSFVVENNRIYLKATLVEDFNKAYEKLQNYKILISRKGSLPKRMDIDLNNYIGFKNLFQIIGINLTEKAFESLKDGILVDGNLKSISRQFEHSNGIFNLIHKRLAYMIENKVEASLIFNESVFTTLASFLIKFNTQSTFDICYKNNSGEIKNTIIHNSYFVERVINLKFNPALLKQLFENPFSKSSYWLSYLYNKHTQSNNLGQFHRIFKYYTMDEYKTKNGSKTVDKLDKKEKIQLRLSLFYNQGYLILKSIPVHKFVIPVTSEKHNLLIVQSVGKIYNLVDDRLCEQDANFLRSQLFTPEASRIIYSQKNGIPNIDVYNSRAFKFFMLSKLNDEEDLWKEGILKDEILVDKKYHSIIDNVILDFIKIECKKTYSIWEELKILSSGREGIYSDKMNYIDKEYAKTINSSESYFNEASSVVLNYVINYMVAHANIQMLILNDAAFDYNTNKDSVSVLSSFHDDNSESTKEQSAIINVDKVDFNFPPNNKFSFLVIKDTDIKDQELEYISSFLAGQTETDEDIRESLRIKTDEVREYSSLKEHLKRLVYSGVMAEKEAKRIYKIYLTSGKISKVDLATVLVQLKTFYYNTYVTNGTISPLCISTSSLPLIKELTVNTDLDELREFLEDSKNKLQFAVFESGIKKGKILNPLKLFDKNGNVIQGALNSKEAKNAVIRNLPRNGHGIRNQ